MYYAIFHAPGSLTDLREVRKAIASTPIGDPLFRLLFSLLLAEGIGLYALLSAGAPAQPFPFLTDLFGCLGMFLGFYGSGLYIALREYASVVTRPPASPLARLIGTRLAGAAVLAYSLWCYAEALPQQTGVADALKAFWELAGKDRYVWASAVDIVVLTVVKYGPLAEDMRRRGLEFGGTHTLRHTALALAALAVPGAGLGMYMLLRPRITYPTEKHPTQKRA